LRQFGDVSQFGSSAAHLASEKWRKGSIVRFATSGGRTGRQKSAPAIEGSAAPANRIFNELA
jgi:hypothetical protein